MKLRVLIQKLKALGYSRASQVGSHVKYRNVAGASVVVSEHRKDLEVKRYVAQSILDDAIEKAQATS